MTKLEAINAVLRRIGLTPVAALDTAGNSATSQAERFLDDADIEFQSRGWHFNTKVDVAISVDGNGKIPIPAGTIYRIDSSGGSSDIDVRSEGGFLYDIANNTDIFTSAVTVTYSKRADWTDLPQTFANHAISVASLNFNRAHRRDENMEKVLREEVARRWVDAKREENETDNANILNTPEMNQIRGRPKNNGGY